VTGAKPAAPSASPAVLLVEDDVFKQRELQAALLELMPTAKISVGRSVRQAVSLLSARRYDLILLDMALPSHEVRPAAAQPMSQPSGGVELLLELSFEGREDPVIIVTQYPEIEFDGRFYSLVQFIKAFGRKANANLKGAVYFNVLDGGWRADLQRLAT
jgi:CheY-like chemotaxis protein